MKRKHKGEVVTATVIVILVALFAVLVTNPQLPGAKQAEAEKTVVAVQE